MSPLRIAYFGTPAFAVPALRALIASRHPVVVLVSQPDRPRGRGQQMHTTPTKVVAESAGVPVLQPTRLKDETFHDELRAYSPDLGVVAAYGRIIPDAVLQIPRLGLINIHASLLPRFRGAAPIHRAVMAGESETGVTIMRVVSELDAGPTFAMERYRIAPDATTTDVERALAQVGAALVLRVIDQIAAGTAVETPQDHTRATYASKIEREEASIDWALPAERIHDLVRGLQPWPLVTANIGGVSCRVHRTSTTSEKTAATPGTVIEAASGLLRVATGGGGVLQIDEIQPEGKRVMSARDFLAGRRIQPGVVITR